MNQVLIVMAGGALGAGGRYTVASALTSQSLYFPWATLVINVIGGLAMGLVAGTLARLVSGAGSGESWRLFLGVGVLGGFTTFSAFSLETFTLIERGDVWLALGYALLSVIGSVAMLGLGLSLVRAL